MKYTTLLSSSSGNCVYIEGGNTRVLVDVGCSLTYLRSQLEDIGVSLRDIDAILLTHEHQDHVSGVAPLAVRYRIPVYASPDTWDVLPFVCRLDDDQRRDFVQDMPLGDLKVRFFLLSHDARQPVGMVFSCGRKKIGLMTDTGLVNDKMIASLRGVNGLILEANHSEKMLQAGPYPAFLKSRISGRLGHLSNRQSVRAFNAIATEELQSVLLAHLSQTNNTADVMLQEFNGELAALDRQTPCPLYVAPPQQRHPLLVVE